VGYYTDPNMMGLVLCGQRWYQPENQRWMSRDPEGYGGGENLYAYCGDNPVAGVDPDGTAPFTLPADPGGLISRGWKQIHHGHGADTRWESPTGKDALEYHPPDPDAATRSQQTGHWHQLKPGNAPGKWDYVKPRKHSHSGDVLDLSPCSGHAPKLHIIVGPIGTVADPTTIRKTQPQTLPHVPPLVAPKIPESTPGDIPEAPQFGPAPRIPIFEGDPEVVFA
jgi:RHS repeat-associated protein